MAEQLQDQLERGERNGRRPPPAGWPAPVALRAASVAADDESGRAEADARLGVDAVVGVRREALRGDLLLDLLHGHVLAGLDLAVQAEPVEHALVRDAHVEDGPVAGV